MPAWRSIHGAGITMPSAPIRASVGRHRWLSRQPGSVGARNGTGRSRDLRASRPVPLRRAPKTNSITQRKVGEHVTALVGFGGAGKTSLAAKWLQSLEPEPEGVFWWNWNREPSVDSFFEEAV